MSYKLNREKSDAELQRERQIIEAYFKGRPWVRCTKGDHVIDLKESDASLFIQVNPTKDELDQIICDGCDEVEEGALESRACMNQFKDNEEDEDYAQG